MSDCVYKNIFQCVSYGLQSLLICFRVFLVCEGRTKVHLTPHSLNISITSEPDWDSVWPNTFRINQIYKLGRYSTKYSVQSSSSHPLSVLSS